MDKTFRFPCDRWLAKNDDDGQIMRELACANNDYLDLNEKTSKDSTCNYTLDYIVIKLICQKYNREANGVSVDGAAKPSQCCSQVVAQT